MKSSSFHSKGIHTLFIIVGIALAALLSMFIYQQYLSSTDAVPTPEDGRTVDQATTTEPEVESGTEPEINVAENEETTPPIPNETPTSTNELATSTATSSEEFASTTEQMASSTSQEGGETEPPEKGQIGHYEGAVLAGTDAPLFAFDPEDYEKALASGKLIVLYFYASWCPLCQFEIEEALYPAFNELTNENVIGFRVHYKDGETTNAERDLAQAYGILSQHTKVFLKKDAALLKSPETWSKERYLSEITEFASN